MNYPYTQDDLLKKPQKYQMSPYFGKTFLLSYFKSRMAVITKFERTSQKQITLTDYLSTLNPNLSINELENLDQEFNTEELLCLILLEITNDRFNVFTKRLLNNLIKKFEIKKLLFLSYQPDFKNSSENFSNLRNYLLLSLVCLILYESSFNLKYLNTSLKLNDILCSQQEKKISNEIDYFLIEYILKKEIELILKLCKFKGIQIKWKKLE